MKALTKKIQLVLGMIVLVAFASILLTDSVAALNMVDGINAARGEMQPTELFGSSGVITTLTNILLFVVGALSVIMIIIGGLRYVVSGGNATAVTAAKNTILYAVVGLVIAFLAFAAVNFVMGTLMPGPGSGYTDV